MAEIELIAAKAVTKALTKKKWLPGAKKNFAQQLSKRGYSLPAFVEEQLITETYNLGIQQRLDSQAARAAQAPRDLPAKAGV